MSVSAAGQEFREQVAICTLDIVRAIEAANMRALGDGLADLHAAFMLARAQNRGASDMEVIDILSAKLTKDNV